MIQQPFSFFQRSFCLLLAFIVLACTSERKPDHVLSEEEMIRVLIQLYENEEKINRLNLRRDSAEKIFEIAKPIIFERIGVSDTTFSASMDYYGLQPVVLDKIYAVVVDSLNLREQKLNVSNPMQ